MKKLLLLLIIPFLSVGQIVTEDCNSIPDPGICLAYIQIFYFNQTTSQCEESYWGGCGGVVPFWTLEDCQNSCENIEIQGCTDETACNYDDLATEDDGSCEYPDLGYDCSGNCLEDLDDDGLCDSACPFMIFETEDCDCVFDSATYTVYYYDVDEVGCITYEMCYCECYNDSDEDGICDENENNTQIEELSNTKQRIKIIDILGRETTNNKSFQLEVYDDGSVEKKYVIK